MAEWLKAHAWKACIPQGIQGSNPCLSAISKLNVLESTKYNKTSGLLETASVSPVSQVPPFGPLYTGKPYHEQKTVPRYFPGKWGLCILLSLLPCSASAATKFYSTFAKGNAIPAECVQEVSIVNPLLAEFHSPADWTWIVACDEPAWHKIEVMSGFEKAVNGQVMGLTDLDRHITYVRDWVMLHPLIQATEAQPRHVIAHELGHVLGNTRDEVEAEAKGRELMKGEQITIATR
jgi:hypothetical protein